MQSRHNEDVLLRTKHMRGPTDTKSVHFSQALTGNQTVKWAHLQLQRAHLDSRKGILIFFRGHVVSLLRPPNAVGGP